VDNSIAKHVALLDDVMTTGSTIETCTKLLLNAGAERVDIWIIARTPEKDSPI
jgi:predicted amidophosphoribosyltransferase